MSITARTNICIIIGSPIDHSLSPMMHNACYQALGIDSKYVYIAAEVAPEDLFITIRGLRAMHVVGITCTIPHKVAVIPYLDTLDTHAEKIGAVNTIVNTNGILTGYNTDYLGVTKSLLSITQIKDKHVAIIGAGGAAHAAIYACLQQGAIVTIYNRTPAKAQELAKKFNCQYESFEQLYNISNADIIINTTTVGMDTQETVIPKSFLRKEQVVFDIIYTPYETQLLIDAKELGATVIHGTEMLLHQGLAQFALFTGRQAPEEIMRKVIKEHIK